MRNFKGSVKGIQGAGLALLFGAVLAASAQAADEEDYGMGTVTESCVLLESTDGSLGECVDASNLKGLLKAGAVEVGETVVVKFVSVKSNSKSGNCCRGHVIIMK